MFAPKTFRYNDEYEDEDENEDKDKDENIVNNINMSGLDIWDDESATNSDNEKSNQEEDENARNSPAHLAGQ